MSMIEVKDGTNVKNAVVYGLYESIRRAKFPMSTNINNLLPVEELSYWLENDFLSLFLAHQESQKYPHYELIGDGVKVTLLSKQEIYIDEEDLPSFFREDWHFSGYCKNKKGELLHRFLLKDFLKEDSSLVVDHIDKNIYNNRKSNLRLATKQQNCFNAKLSKNNSSSVTGVSWDKSKNKWRAYIFYNGCQIHIGRYEDFSEAVRARLLKEKEMFGEFAPQIHLFEQYNIEKVEVNATVLPKFLELKEAIKYYQRIKSLSCTKTGEGHDQALTGIVVQFDLEFTVKAWTEAERYHFFDFVSSQSTMHRITKFEGDKYISYVDKRIQLIMEEKIREYNEMEEGPGRAEKYLEILYSNPCGMKLTAGMTTNYRQLKTIYAQRKTHRLPEWREFCKWVETLPHSEFIIGKI